MVMWTRAAVMPRMDMMVRDSSPCRARCSFNCCWNSVWPSTDWLSNSSYPTDPEVTKPLPATSIRAAPTSSRLTMMVEPSPLEEYLMPA